MTTIGTSVMRADVSRCARRAHTSCSASRQHRLVVAGCTACFCFCVGVWLSFFYFCFLLLTHVCAETNQISLVESRRFGEIYPSIHPRPPASAGRMCWPRMVSPSPTAHAIATDLSPYTPRVRPRPIQPSQTARCRYPGGICVGRVSKPGWRRT